MDFGNAEELLAASIAAAILLAASNVSFGAAAAYAAPAALRP